MNASKFLGSLGVALALAAASGALSPLCFSQSVSVTSATPEPTTGIKWTDIKGDTYDQRGHFAWGAGQLAARLTDEIRQLNAKRAAMTTDTKDWDFAMKDVLESRDQLMSRLTEVNKATTPETWADAKDKVGEAWQRSQLAVDNMHTTVTS
jgi:hypothetical protein